jgi:hypothetical protein
MSIHQMLPKMKKHSSNQAKVIKHTPNMDNTPEFIVLTTVV